MLQMDVLIHEHPYFAIASLVPFYVVKGLAVDSVSTRIQADAPWMF